MFSPRPNFVGLRIMIFLWVTKIMLDVSTPAPSLDHVETFPSQTVVDTVSQSISLRPSKFWALDRVA